MALFDFFQISPPQWADQPAVGARPRLSRFWGSYASDHELGANFVFCDGSVHFIDEAIDPTVFRALITINGGEVIDDFDLKGKE